MMILMQRGVVDLCDPVSKYLPGFKNQTVHTADGIAPVNRDVTIKDLLCMVSGLPYGHPETEVEREVAAVFDELISKLHTDSPISTLELANRLGGCGLMFQPGEYFKYGTSADIAGAVIEAATGKRLGVFLREEIFEPLHMHDTDFYVPEQKQGRLVKTYEETPSGMVEYKGDMLGIQNRMTKSPAFESGGAGLASTIDDYQKFAAMLMNGGSAHGRQILTPKALEFFTSPALTEAQKVPLQQRWDGLSGFNYGNFMRIMEHPGQAKYMTSKGEYGWDGALGCYFANSPADKLTFVLMTQRKDSGTIALTRKCRNVLFSALD
jgi:CubicO group peptidase (beta-lactamase class C family)